MTLNSKLISKLKPNMVAILGVPFDKNSSFMQGPALAPGEIHKALHSGASNFCIEDGRDLAADKRWSEVGELELSDSNKAFERITNCIDSILKRDAHVISLGGDHSVTLPILRAYAKKYSKLNLLQIDAHPDLYDELDGNRYSHATPMLRSLEEGLACRLVQMGIRTMTPAQHKRATQYKVETIEMRKWKPRMIPKFDGPVYLTVDIDGLDPAFAPGVSHHEPGGFSTRELLSIIQNLDVDLVGADIVELNPKRDPIGVTAAVSIKLLKEIIGKMLK